MAKVTEMSHLAAPSRALCPSLGWGVLAILPIWHAENRGSLESGLGSYPEQMAVLEFSLGTRPQGPRLSHHPVFRMWGPDVNG